MVVGGERWGGRPRVPEKTLESTGAEELNSSGHIGLETEPIACQAKCQRSPNCWKLKATLEEDMLQGGEG